MRRHDSSQVVGLHVPSYYFIQCSVSEVRSTYKIPHVIVNGSNVL